MIALISKPEVLEDLGTLTSLLGLILVTYRNT